MAYNPSQIVFDWLVKFEQFAASSPASIDAVEEHLNTLFLQDAYWRDFLVSSWDLRTLHSPRGIATWLVERSVNETLPENCDAPNRLAISHLHSFHYHKGPGRGSNAHDGNTCPAPALIDVPFAVPSKEGTIAKQVTASFQFRMGSESDTTSTPSKVGRGRGVVHLRPCPATGEWKAWTFLLMLDPEGMDGLLKTPTQGSLDTNGDPFVFPDFKTEIEHRHEVVYESERDQWRRRCEESPVALVVGGGHAGLSAAASLQRHGVPTLLIERHPHVGDSWRTRYKSLTLHTPTFGAALPYMQFPASYPRYLPKDLLAEFLRAYASTMDLVVWTNTELVSGSAEYNEETSTWSVKVSRVSATAGGKAEIVTLHPRHLVLALGLFTKPNMPTLPGTSNFTGRIFHTSQWPQLEGSELGRRVVIVGCGNSAVDVANDNAVRGAQSVTMVQRSVTCVQSSVFFDYMADLWAPSKGRAITDSDILLQADPERFFGDLSRERVKRLDKVLDRDMHEALQKKGLKLWWGPTDMGILELVFGRFGGFWWDTGCARRVIEGRIGVKSGVEIAKVGGEEGRTVWFTDGSCIEADDVVFATGYDRFDERAVARLLDGGSKPGGGAGIIEKLGKVGVQDVEHESAGFYRPTGHPGLWIASLPFMMARVLSPLLAIQIKAIEAGIMPRNAPAAPHNATTPTKIF